MLVRAVFAALVLSALQAGGLKVPTQSRADDVAGPYLRPLTMIEDTFATDRLSLDMDTYMLYGDGLEEAAGVDPSPDDQPRHPLWHFEGFQLTRVNVLICALSLFFAGLLCSAGGIGGGGIYVTVLMVAGGLSVTDAVPLSKAIVFSGSVSSLVLNFKKSVVTESSTRTLIDYNICRLVIPSALIGTFLGVLLNRILAGWIILLMLTFILVCMTVLVTNTTLQQRREEEELDKRAIASGDDEMRVSGRDNQTLSPELTPEHNSNKAAAPSSHMTSYKCERSNLQGLRNTLTTSDVSIALTILVLLIFFSVFRYHASACQQAVTDERAQVCNHPIMFFLTAGRLEGWMAQPHVAMFLMAFTFVFPLSVCLLVLGHYSHLLVMTQGWHAKTTAAYNVMAMITGCLAGLVGIGGGLIFSPFFLLMGIEPSIAVATSSTCVIFTSSSTAMQYLLTDRIIMSLTLVYGLVNLVASYAGTTFVHNLQDNFSARRSYISAIVGLGVLISAALSIGVLISSIHEG